MSRPSGLGRGLSALIPATTAIEARDDEVVDPTEVAGVTVLHPEMVSGGGGLEMVSVSDIYPNPYQPRTVFDDERLSGLTASIREVGVLQPVLLRKTGDHYELVAGERRWLAARKAGLVVVPALVREVTNQDSLEQSIVENLHRDDLSPLEEAAAYLRLMDEFGLTQQEVGTRVGRSRSSVANSLRLLDLPGDVQRLLAAGDISAGHARSLAGLTDRQIQKTLAIRVVAEGLSVRQTEDLVRSLDERSDVDPTDVQSKPTTTRDAMVLEVEEALSRCFDTSVRVITRGGRGRVVLEFADRDDLQRLFSLLTT